MPFDAARDRDDPGIVILRPERLAASIAAPRPRRARWHAALCAAVDCAASFVAGAVIGATAALCLIEWLR
jgi:hypothetical protein